MKRVKISATRKKDVVSAYFRERDEYDEFETSQVIAVSSYHVSCWSDTCFGLSASEIEWILNWN